ncbi:Uncharacterized protein TPAR_03806 [Tolypocladium paradoxum]|uniref:Carrier domain-containing protein n=1 Tax=Tolypocladium paradoxum TaxID=94208 RepID=A0A2S4L0L9_9HYPO|nr:Uncharacterized protein TPAR_03806 [Tolypocladium paradoxum]
MLALPPPRALIYHGHLMPLRTEKSHGESKPEPHGVFAQASSFSRPRVSSMASIETLRQTWAEVLGIETSEFGDDDNFMDLGGDSFLGEVASYAADVDLGAFMNTNHDTCVETAGTIKSFWEVISKRPRNVNGITDGHEDAGNGAALVTPENSKASSDITPGLGAGELAPALERAGIAKDNVLRTAPVSSVQGNAPQSAHTENAPRDEMACADQGPVPPEFFLRHSLSGDMGPINYVYEVEGPELKEGLRHLTQLLEAKNPIFRTTIVDVGGDTQKFAQVLLAKCTPSWSYPPDLQSYIEGTMTWKFQLGAPAVQYALVVGDAALEGRSFFAICLHHTHCDAFSRFLLGKEMLQILRSPSNYARADNPQRPWFGDFVRHLHKMALDVDVSGSWDNYMRGADVANIHLPDQALVNGELDGVVTDTLPVPSTHPCRGHNGDVPRNPTHVVLAAWAMALAKPSGLRDVVFGLCRHGRSSSSLPDVRRVMGPLVNAVPFRMSVERREEPVTGLLQRVQDEIATTGKWEQGFAPGIFPSADGRPWVQSLINLKSALHGATGTCAADDGSTPAITKMLPRADLDMYEFKGPWAVMLLIRQHRDIFEVSMHYQSPLVGRERAEALFGDFKRFMEALTNADRKSVGDMLE